MALSESKKNRLKNYYLKRDKRYRNWILQSLGFVVIIQAIYLITEWNWYTQEAEMSDILRKLGVSVLVGFCVYGAQMLSNERSIKNHKEELGLSEK